MRRAEQDAHESEQLARTEDGDAALVAIDGAHDLDGTAGDDEDRLRLAARRVQHRAAGGLEDPRRRPPPRRSLPRGSARRTRDAAGRPRGRTGRDAADRFRPAAARAIARAGRSSGEAIAAILAFTARSLSASTSVTACCSSRDAGWRWETTARKSSKARNQPSTWAVATTVAVQVPASTSAISPKMSPPARRATTKQSPPGAGTRASALPSRRTNAPRAASPWRTRVAALHERDGARGGEQELARFRSQHLQERLRHGPPRG